MFEFVYLLLLDFLTLFYLFIVIIVTVVRNVKAFFYILRLFVRNVVFVGLGCVRGFLRFLFVVLCRGISIGRCCGPSS